MSRYYICVWVCDIFSVNILSCWCPVSMHVRIYVPQIPADSEVRSSCVEALRWARRFLPFSNFLNAEEMLQDVLLSLVSELPPISLVKLPISCLFLHKQCLSKHNRLILSESFSHLLPTLLYRLQTRWCKPSQERKSLSESRWEKSITRCYRDWGNAVSLVWTPLFINKLLWNTTQLWKDVIFWTCACKHH